MESLRTTSDTLAKYHRSGSECLQFQCVISLQTYWILVPPVFEGRRIENAVDGFVCHSGKLGTFHKLVDVFEATDGFFQRGEWIVSAEKDLICHQVLLSSDQDVLVLPGTIKER